MKMENKKIVQKCINSIEVDETLKKDYLNYTEQLISHSKNKINRKNYYKRFVTIAIAIIMIVIFTNTLAYACLLYTSSIKNIQAWVMI